MSLYRIGVHFRGVYKVLGAVETSAIDLSDLRANSCCHPYTVAKTNNNERHKKTGPSTFQYI